MRTLLRTLLTLVLPLALLVPQPASGAPSATPRRRAIVLLVPGMASEPFLESLARPEWAEFRSLGSVALVNCAAPGPDTRVAACLSIGAGRRMAPVRSLRPAAPVVDGQPAGLPGYYGEVPSTETPERWAFAIPMFPAMLQLDMSRPEFDPGVIGTALREQERKVAYVGAYAYGGFSSPGFLVAVDRAGSVPRVVAVTPGHSEPEEFVAASRRALAAADFVVIDLPIGTTPGEALGIAARLAPDLHGSRDLLIVASTDPGDARHGQWTGLGAALLCGDEWQAARGGSLSSATTRTPMLLANTDLAPTVLQHLGLKVPASVEGHPCVPVSAALSEVLAFSRQARANRRAMVPGLVGWGAVAFVGVILSGICLLRPATETRRSVAHWLLVLSASVPLALLLTAALSTASVPQVLLSITGISIAVASAAWAGRRWNACPVVTVFAALWAVIVLDLLTGRRMLARNLMSDFANVGARFYGMGNEYEGLFLGSAVLAVFWAAHRWTGKAPGTLLLAALWIPTLALVGGPAWGADFGGMVSFALTFLIGAALASGRRPKPAQVLLGLGAVVVLVIAAVAWDYTRGPGVRTHVGELAARVMAVGLRPLVETISRKVQENVSMAFSPYFAGAMLLVLPLLWVGYYLLGKRLTDLLRRQPVLATGAGVTLLGGVILLLLNDTGVIAWALATGCALLFVLSLLLQDRMASSTPLDRPSSAASTAPAEGGSA